MAAAPASTTLATREPRPLGIRRKPQLRLALGYRDENKKGAPVKTDYFIPKGNESAVAKFKKVYGDKPRAIDVRLPGSLGAFLEIKHLAFAGGQSDTGGILKAVGRTNFALEGTLGGPDVLTVFNVADGKLTVDEVEISGADDPAAVALGVQLTTTVAFGIPDVLGFGGVCAITSRGKETTDTLWETAVDVYGNLGAAASMILRPKLILKESKMLTPQGQRAAVYVLDLYVPESRDEIMAAAREYRELLPGRARFAREMLYGPIAGELPSPDSPEWDLVVDEEDTPAESADGEGGSALAGQQAEAVAEVSSEPAAASAPDSYPDEPSMEDEPGSAFVAPDGAVSPETLAAQEAADSAGRYTVDRGRNGIKDHTIAQIGDQPKGDEWLFWILAGKRDGSGDVPLDHPARPYAEAFVRFYKPELYAEAKTALDLRSGS